MAHFHIPKPLHGWREFIGEVGIIVMGVLIALAAEQVVESLHNRSVAQKTRNAPHDEIDEGLVAVQLRGTAEPCIHRRLTEVRQLVDEWAEHGTFKRPLWVAQTPQIGVSFTRYNAALSAGRLALLPQEEQYQIGEVVGDLREFQATQDEENKSWPKLRMLEAGPDALTASDRTVIRTALQEALYEDYGARRMIRQLLPLASHLGFRPDPHRFQSFVRDVWKNGKYTPSICARIDTPPAIANRITQQVTPLPE